MNVDRADASEASDITVNSERGSRDYDSQNSRALCFVAFVDRSALESLLRHDETNPTSSSSTLVDLTKDTRLQGMMVVL